MNLQTQNRASNGRFMARGQKDPKIENVYKRIALEDEQARLYIKVCELVGPPITPKFLGIKKHVESGNWTVESWTRNFFYGFISGVYFAVKEKNRKNVVSSVLALINEARAIEQKKDQLEHELYNLVKQGN